MRWAEEELSCTAGLSAPGTLVELDSSDLRHQKNQGMLNGGLLTYPQEHCWVSQQEDEPHADEYKGMHN